MRPRNRIAPRGTGMSGRRWPPEQAAAVQLTRPVTARPGVTVALTVVPAAPVAEERRTHRDPSNFPIDLPEAGRGEDRIRVQLPPGTRFALADLEIGELSPLADLEITDLPARGSEGSVEIGIRWSHAPYGRIAYTLKVYANADGRPPAVTVVDGSTGFAQRSRALIRQDAPVTVEVRGPLADGLRLALERAAPDAAPARASEAITIGVIAIVAGIGIAALGAVLIAVGLFVFYNLVQEAMRRDYDVEDTGFRAAVGEGTSRTEQAMVFNLKRRGAD
ncbi:MAG: hypothetical protein ACXW3O_00550 [Brevundimonas sp.]